MEPRLKPVAALAVVAILAFALTTCSNPIDFVAEVKDQVMLANDKYLEVTSVAPVKGATLVSTWATIVIEFDRAIDMATVDETTLLIEPATDLGTPLWNASTHTLSLKPPALDGQKTYTITVTKAVKGDDDSSVRDDYSWSFTTKKAPSGTVVVDGGASYTHDGTVSLDVSFNTQAIYVGYSETSTDFDNPDWLGWTSTGSLVGGVDSFDLSPGDGTKTVYTRFMDAEDAMTPLVSHVIVLDSVAPSVEAGADQTLNIAASSKTLDATASDATSGIASITWSKTGGPGTVTFGSASSEDTTVSTGTDGTYTLTLTVVDQSGLSASDTVTVYRDLTAPAVNAGGNKNLRRLVPTASINATTSDAIGIASWLWEKTAGPGTLTFGTASAEDTTVSGSADGTYTARLTVTDLRGNTTQASITIYRDILDPVITSAAFPGYLNIAAPTYTPAWTATDANTITYSWAQVAGTSNAVTFSNLTVLSPLISAAIDATSVQVRLTATDSVGNTATATSSAFTIDRAVPSVNPGGNKIINIGNPTGIIDATTSDATSGVASRAWTKVSGPGTLTFTAPSADDTNVTASVDGTYVARLTATDNAGNSTSATISILQDKVAPTVSVLIDAGAATSNDTSVILNLTVNDATSGVHYYATNNDATGWTGWMTYSTTTPTHVIQNLKGTRTVQVQLQDYAGNNGNIASDTIVLMAKIVVTFTHCLLVNDGDPNTIGNNPGEIYYSFYLNGSRVIYRSEATRQSWEDVYDIAAALPPTTAPTLYLNPTSGVLTVSGTIWDDDSPLADDYGNGSRSFNPPFVDAANQILDINGDVQAGLYFNIDVQN